jgi:hypothetical protein
MSVTAHGPDGSTFSFPDGTPQEVVRRALGKHYGWSDASTAAPAMGDVFQMIGGLIPTYLLGSLFVWLLKRFISGASLAILANSLALGACFFLAALGIGGVNNPKWDAGFLYVLPQIVWLVRDLTRFKQQGINGELRSSTHP